MCPGDHLRRGTTARRQNRHDILEAQFLQRGFRPLPQGLGARHKSAAAVTAATSAVAIAISESTGNVTIFEKGKILFEIEKPRPVGHQPPAQGHLYQREPEPIAEDL